MSTKHPINAANGNKYLFDTDYLAASGGLVFSYAYSRRSTAVVGALGTARLHYYDRSIISSLLPGGTQMAQAVRPQGVVYLFFGNNNIYASQEADVTDKLVALTTGWQYTVAADNSVETYAANGKLLSIRDRTGLVQTLTYSDSTTPVSIAPAPGLLIRVTDAYGRQLNFTYDGNGRIHSLINPAGNQYLYGYDANNNLASVTYPDSKIKQYLYGEVAYVSATPNAGVSYTHSMTGIIDENGVRYASYWYDALGRAYKEQLAPDLNLGIDQYQVTFGTGNTVITDPLGTARTYNFQGILGVHKVTGQSQPGGSGCGAASSAKTFDANGNVATRTDFQGNVTKYSYDLTRNLETSRIEAFGKPEARTITTQWHAAFRLPTLIAEPLRITTYTYDADGNQLTRTLQPTTDTTGAAGAGATASGTPRTTTYTYRKPGQVLTVDGPRADATDVTTYTYYDMADPDLGKRGNLATVRNALNQVTTVGSYDANGKPTSITDPNGLVTGFTYDVRGRLTDRDPGNNGAEKTHYTYDGVGQLLTVTVPSGAIYTYTYDPAHRLTDIADNSGNHIHYTLDAIGNRTKEETFDSSNTLVQTHSRTFDALNRLYQDIGAVNQTTTYAYDANGNLTGITDPLNRQTINAYDALNRLSQTTDAAKGITRYGYDGLDQLVSVTDPKTLITQYQRDGLGNLNQQTSPDTGTTANTYDAAGNVLTRTDAKGQVATYTYDALNRIIGISYK